MWKLAGRMAALNAVIILSVLLVSTIGGITGLGVLGYKELTKESRQEAKRQELKQELRALVEQETAASKKSFPGTPVEESPGKRSRFGGLPVGPSSTTAVLENNLVNLPIGDRIAQFPPGIRINYENTTWEKQDDGSWMRVQSFTEMLFDAQ